MLDMEPLAAPLPDTGNRLESPMKYLAMWGSQRVNINTAPRHVLEAAFTFGGDAEDIAEEIIQLRRERPFKDLKDLKSRLYGFNDSIEKTTPYITTVSTYLSIRVTATNGRARSASVATVIKNGNKVERIAIITQ
jgi:type II secretory pathway component PulK